MTTFLLISVALLILAVATTIVSALRAKDGYEDHDGYHPVPHADQDHEPAVGRFATRASSR
jgi:hypothetical protein